ncbi:MAG: universal stress protein [Brumimicrobium sp.]|nr:universal stress protein [Brumimicrobium sp.]
MTKILFPTDFSEAAKKAFLYALELTERLNAQLTVFHVYELPELGRSMKTTTQEVYELMELETFENFKKSVKQLHDFAGEHGYEKVNFNQLMAEGETVHTITRMAEKEQVDYIIMGTKGATGLKEVLLGSVASGVIDNAHCPVISIPQNSSPHKNLNRIAYLTNYKDEELAAFVEIKEFAGIFDASMYCIHFENEIKDISSEQMKEWKNKLGDSANHVRFEVISGDDFEKALTDFYVNEKIDLIGIQPRKRNFFEKIFSKSVSKKLAHHIEIPLYTVPAK